MSFTQWGYVQDSEIWPPVSQSTATSIEGWALHMLSICPLVGDTAQTTV